MAKFTQKMILYTFQEMLETTPFDKITVSAIVSKCGISSNTFYYHYRDIYDLLDTWLLEKREKYIAEVHQHDRWQDALKIILRDFKAHSKIVYHLFDSLSRDRIERVIFETADDSVYQFVRQQIGDTSLSEETLREVTEYHSYAFLGFFIKFLWHNMESDIDSYVDRIGEIFENSIQWVADAQRK